jgi:FkbM family methyltransferase
MNCIKAGVQYNLVDVPSCIKPWLQSVFHKWEPETFEVFNFIASRGKDITVLDLGAYIGLTAVWLCSNFKHVICVDADHEAIKSLKKNLCASKCTNFHIIDLAVYSESGKTLTFGPNKFRHGSVLNDSTSQIKLKESHSLEDYSVKTISVRDLIDDSVGFIKCDIEGGEEHILRDLFNHRIPLYISFHLSWWDNPDISRFSDLFQSVKDVYVNGIVSEKDPISWLKKNPFGSVLILF